ncbi:MAG: DUF748 domain-containing protein [Burkholderiaceae bacterium]
MTPMPAWRRALLALAAVVAVALAALTYAVHDAKARILQALGPRAEVGELSLGYPVVTLRDVRIAADPAAGAWPAKEEFHAALVAVRIDAGSLWALRRGQALRISDVRVEDGVLVMLRTQDRLTTLPALRETTGAQAAAGGVSLIVERARVDRMAVDLIDGTLPDGALHRLRFERVRGTVAGVALPALSRPIAVDLDGVLKGAERDGTVSIKGTLTPAAHDADLGFRLAGIDMVALRPYLARFSAQPVRRGRLDMTLDAHVVDRVVDAPGHLVLTGLEFGGGGDTLGGVEKRAVLAALEKDGRIDLKFKLQGRTDDPKFTLDEKLGIRIAAVLGEAVGLSVEGAVQGVGDMFKGLLGGAKGGNAGR